MKKSPNIIYVFVAFAFISLLPLQALSNPGPANSTEIIFTKSSQTLGNTMTFGIDIADVDLDQDYDIFVANYSDFGPSRLWLNDGHGNFTMHSQQFTTGVPSPHDVAMADLNGDDYPDIFLVNHNATSQIYFSDGSGSYIESGQSIGHVNDHPQTVQLIDIDDDGDMDAYIYNSSAANRIWINDGNGFFTMRDVDYGGANSSRQVMADFNGDGCPDLYVSLRNAPAQIWMNDGEGNITFNGQTLNAGGDAISCQDIDGDGDIDMVIANYNETTICINQNNSGTFGIESYLGEGATRCQLFDADLDGDVDLLTGYLENGNKLWINDGSGHFYFYKSLFIGDRIFSIACQDLDGDQDIDIVVGKEPNTGGNAIYFNETIISQIDETELAVNHFMLFNNYPNPFNPRTSIVFSTPQKGWVTLTVFNIRGEKISGLLNQELPAGEYRTEFDGSNLTSGIYFYQLKTDFGIQTRKMLLLE